MNGAVRNEIGGIKNDSSRFQQDVKLKQLQFKNELENGVGEDMLTFLKGNNNIKFKDNKKKENKFKVFLNNLKVLFRGIK